ncbi:hypothetical protein GTY38_20400 [Streptomyces sp. SID8369]|nr:hypothetical protein [Streptomyces sp. SID8369]
MDPGSVRCRPPAGSRCQTLAALASSRVTGGEGRCSVVAVAVAVAVVRFVGGSGLRRRGGGRGGPRRRGRGGRRRGGRDGGRRG